MSIAVEFARALLFSAMVSAASLSPGASWAVSLEHLNPQAQWTGADRVAAPAGSAGAFHGAFLVAQHSAEVEEQTSDTTPPLSSALVVPAPTIDGWNNTDVNVTVTAADEESGIRETSYSLSGAQAGGATIYSGVASFDIVTEGVTSVTYAARDNADNQEGAQTLVVRLDKSPPRIGLTCPAAASLRAPAVASVNVSDALSGVAFQSAGNGTAVLDTSKVGSGTLTVTAQDRAGNTASETCVYQVVYEFAGAGGFKPPLVAPPAVNAVSAGATIPVTWQLPDGTGGFVSDLSVVLNVAVRRVECPGPAAAPVTELAPRGSGGASVLHFDTAASQFIYYWKTDPSMRGDCYLLTLVLEDGTEHSVRFTVR